MWDEARDARLYAGPWPVVAHPPCARWSRLAGFTEARFGLRRGQDGGCFAAALEAVRTFGGVLEHPAYSAAWDEFGLPEPQTVAGWTGGMCGGWSAYVEQGRYGLPAKKATWLYAFEVELPPLEWGRVPDMDGDRPRGEWGGIDGWRDSWANGRKVLSSSTPPAFRDVLLGMARSALPVKQRDEQRAEARAGASSRDQQTQVVAQHSSAPRQVLGQGVSRSLPR